MENDSEHETPTETFGTTPSDSPSFPPATTEPTERGTQPTQPVPRAEWYLDPWDHTQHRYWDGSGWTAQTFPNGPGPATRATAPVWSAAPQAAEGVTVVPPPPAWAPAPPKATAEPPAPVLATPPPRRNSRTFAAIALVIGLIVGFVIAFAAGTATHRSGASRSSAAPATVPPRSFPTLPSTPGPTTPGPGRPDPATPDPGGPPISSDPAASALEGLVVRQADVTSALTVQPLPGGNRVSGEVTLDLCNASFPSEALRTARLQVVAIDAQGDTPLSTEAVLYPNPGGSAQAFTELRAAAASCPSTPTTNTNGDSVTTHINPAPDGAWAATASVERLTFDFNTTDSLGQTEHWIAVYLRRGRVLEGLYFSAPDKPQPSVGGQTTIPGIVGVFAARIAQLPATVVNG